MLARLKGYHQEMRRRRALRRIRRTMAELGIDTTGISDEALMSALTSTFLNITNAFRSLAKTAADVVAAFKRLDTAAQERRATLPPKPFKPVKPLPTW